MAWTREQFLRAMAAVRVRLRVLPRTGEPIALYREYFRRIGLMREDMMQLMREDVVPLLEDATSHASRIATTDGLLDDMWSKIGNALDRVRRKFDELWPRERASRIVEPVAREVVKFNARNLNRTLSSAIGQTTPLEIVGGEEWLKHAVAEFVAENVALIRSIPSEFFSDMEKQLTRAIADGVRWEDLAQMIEDRYGITENRARTIARDQINKFVGDLNRVRQQDLGIERFVWRTMGDERVRTDKTEGPGEGHRERNGVTYEWTSPPNGETPGEPINCRCYGEPVLPETETD